MSGTSRRLGKRSAQRNRLRRNSDGADQRENRKIAKKKPSQKTKELASNYKTRNSKFKRSAIDLIKTTINKRYVAKGGRRDRLKEFAIRETGSQMVADNINQIRTIESKSLMAHSYVQDGRTKIIIEGITSVDNNSFGMIDSINAIVEDFGHKDLKKVDLFINTNNAQEQQMLEEYLGINKDLIKKVTFVERKAEKTIDDLFDDMDDESGRDDSSSENDIIRISLEPAISSVLDSEYLKFKMKEVPKEKSAKYLDVINKLDIYHKGLEKYRDALYSEINPNHQKSPETGNQSSDEILKGMETDINNLKESIKNYIRDSRTLPHKSGTKKKKKDVMGSLLKQLESLNRKTFNEATREVDEISRDIDDIRREVFINQYKPLTEIDINKKVEGRVIGEGDGGAVKAVEFKGDPKFVAAIKIDGASNMEAGKSGISTSNPEQSKRAVSSYLMNQLFKLDLIPDTRFFIRVNPATGLNEIGHAMQFIKGQIGQLSGLRENIIATPEEVQKIEEAKALLEKGFPSAGDYPTAAEHTKAKDEFRDASAYEQGFTFFQGRYVKDLANATVKKGLEQLGEELAAGPPKKADIMDDAEIREYQQLLLDYNEKKKQYAQYTRRNDEYRKVLHMPPSNIDLRNGVVQKSMSDLQLFDYIIGHADRHGENYIFETDSLGNVTGIKGIDNSDAFGAEWTPKSNDDKFSSKTPDIPPVINLETAIKILSLNKPSLIEATLKDLLGKNLSETDIRATFDRLTSLQKKMADGIVSGDIQLATTGIGPSIVQVGDIQSALVDFNEFIDEQTIRESIIMWGGDEVLDKHNQHNSYLGTAKDLGEERGFQNPAYAL